MSENVLDFPQSGDGEPDNHFGGCPVCKKNSGCLNIGRDHWFYCESHKTKWRIRSDLFSGWKNETEEEHSRHANFLSEYIDISGPPTPSEKPPDHRETQDRYSGEIFRQRDYRVVLCRDAIQWIIQRRKKGSAARWLAKDYCTTRKALVRRWAARGCEPCAELNALPATVRGQDGK